MIPSISRGRGHRAPRVIRSTVVYLLLATVGCQSGAPSPVVTSANDEPGKTSAKTPQATVEHEPTVDRKEGGTGTRAKGEEGANRRYAVEAPKSAPAQPLAGAGALQGLSSGQGALAGSARRPSAPKLRAGSVVVNPAPTSAVPWQAAEREFDTEAYSPIVENQLLAVKDHPLSTFSADVDTASFSNARRFLRDGQLPPKDSIRVEEWLNYFSYPYAAPSGDAPVAVHTEVSSCPWAPEHRLVRIGIKARPITQATTPPRNLVFLVDVSGSMQPANKLPLLKNGLGLLARTLRPEDSVAIVVYAGASGLVLPATSGGRQDRILDSLQSLEAGGSTNGGDGIRLAYAVAKEHFKKGGINRVILATDGDFNVGTTSEGELQRLIEDKRKSGIFLTVLGFGDGNVKDSTMEMLADKGNGNYAYIDSAFEARKVLVREAGATLVTVAKDVKLQVEFNPARVQSYRLVGYENRVLAKEDFNDDKKDAGDMGAGHTVTALYEVVPVGAKPARGQAPGVDPLKYQAPAVLTEASARGELLTVAVRYKPPGGETSTKLSHVVADSTVPFASASADQRFAAAVSHFALVLRGSKALGGQTLAESRKLALAALGDTAPEDRRELLAMIDRARALGSSGALVAR
ncbi:MAG TPA: VWA domain-containing protein [Polyangiaceae bacterium]|nr:VWA domain-containing protein [Polyangiaceae bacterium]